MKYVLAAAVMLAACVETGQAGTEWVLESVDGKAADYTATLDLSTPGRLTGQAPCNRYFADLTRDGANFKLGMIGATRMACLQIKGEAEFFQILQGVAMAEQTASALTLTGAGHQMVFVPQAE